MKTLLFLITFISSFSFAQTNIIAAKSHSDFDHSSLSDPDNFGEYILPRKIQQVTYLKEDCIVEMYASERNGIDIETDTICDHPFLQEGSFDIDRIKAMYPEETKFKGFEKAEKAHKKSQKKKIKQAQQQNQQNSSGLIALLIGIGSFLLLLFIHKKDAARV